MPLSDHKKPYLNKSERLAVPPRTELFLGHLPEPWLRGRRLEGMCLTQYGFRLWRTGLSLQHLLLPGVHFSTMVVWKTLRETPGAVKSYTAQSCQAGPLPTSRLQLGTQLSPPPVREPVSVNPIPLHSSPLQKLRHCKKFNTSIQSCLPRVEGLGCSSSTLKCTAVLWIVLCPSQSLDCTCGDTSATSPAPCTLPWGCPHSPKTRVPEFLGMSV